MPNWPIVFLIGNPSPRLAPGCWFFLVSKLRCFYLNKIPWKSWTSNHVESNFLYISHKAFQFKWQFLLFYAPYSISCKHYSISICALIREIIIIIIMFYLAHVVVYIGFSNISNFSSIFSILLIVSGLRAGELSEPLGFLVSSPYNFSYKEKAGNYMVQVTTIIKGLKSCRNNYSNN